MPTPYTGLGNLGWVGSVVMKFWVVLGWKVCGLDCVEYEKWTHVHICLHAGGSMASWSNVANIWQERQKLEWLVLTISSDHVLKKKEKGKELEDSSNSSRNNVNNNVRYCPIVST